MFWQRWLTIWCVGVGVFGLILFGAGFPFTGSPAAQVFVAFGNPLPDEPDPLIVTRRLFEDGRRHLVLRRPLPLPFPVRLLHGTGDATVPVARGLALLDHAEGPDIRLTLVRGADHRFSGPAELDLIARTVAEIAG